MIISADFYNVGSGAISYVGVNISGANTSSATDAIALVNKNSAGSQELQMSRVKLLTGLTSGATTFALAYRVTSSTGDFSGREITVIPL